VALDARRQVRLRLRFRSQSTYPQVKAEFHNPFGGVIKLEGVSHPREESGAAHTEVVLTGRVPESATLGTYDCTSVEGLTGDRKWAPIFEDPAFNIRVVQQPFHAQRGGEFLGLEPTYRAGSLTHPRHGPLTSSRASLVIHPTT
jgi:hypothetical protein